MTSEPTRKADFWEQLDAMSFYRPLSAKTVDQHFSGEVDDAFISHDMGKWWLKVDGVVGEAPHDTLEAAKAAGDAIVEKSDNEMTNTMLTSLGLSSDEWKLEIVQGMPVVTSLTNDEIMLMAGETSPRWSLLQGNDFIIETDDFSAALARAKDLIPSSGPTP
jgi:hypothetical protein